MRHDNRTISILLNAGDDNTAKLGIVTRTGTGINSPIAVAKPRQQKV
jgi:hypothetical protein